jgi:hypothetical protein
MSKSDVTKLCDEIKHLLPPAVMIDPTDQMMVLIQSLRGRGINESELEAIQRAYNYFNSMIGQTQPLSNPTLSSKILGNASNASTTNASNGSLINSSTNASTNESTQTPAQPSEAEQTEMIELLINVFEESKKDT